MKFLIIKTSSLGDIIHALESVIHLKTIFSEAQIDWVVEKPFAEILQKFSLLNEVFVIHTQKWRKKFLNSETWSEIKLFKRLIKQKRYDAVFDLQGNLKSSFVLSQVDAIHKIGFGLKTVSEWPNCFFTRIRFNPPNNQNVRDEYQFIIKEYLKKYHFDQGSLRGNFGEIEFKINHEQQYLIDQIINDPKLKDRFKILVCPGSNWINKQLPCETLNAFLSKINSSRKDIGFIFAWGNEKEKFVTERLSTNFQSNSKVIEKLPLPTLQNLMKNVDLVIAMDSLPLHLCGTTGTASFGIFGPSLAKKFAPVGDGHYSIQTTCPYGKTFDRRCPKLRTCSTGQCMQDIDAQYLFEEFKSYFSKNAESTKQ